MSETTYDLAVIGAGPGGYVAAIRGAQLGGKVCLIEPRELGGTCLNRGCIPSKVILRAAEVFRTVRQGEIFGVKVTGAQVDYAALAQRKQAVVGRLTKGVAGLLKANKVQVVQGTGRISGKREVTVTGPAGTTVVSAAKIILATGSETARPESFPFDGQRVITTDEALDWVALPRRVLLVGAGYSGCEFASALRDLGAEVVLVEMMDQILPRQDPDLAKELARVFAKKGIEIRTGTKIDSMKVEGGVVQARIGNETVTADVAVVCIGRRLNTAGLGLKEMGVEMNGNVVVVNPHCQTSVANIYAIGDITGKALLAHVASYQGLVAAAHAMGRPAKADYRVVPFCAFTDPEVASVGLFEAQAQEQGRKVRTVKFPFQNLGKPQVLDEAHGFMKILAEEGTDAVLGVHIIGPHATDLIGEAALAIRMEATVEELATTIHAHPTLGEVYLETAELSLGTPIHTAPARKP